MKRFAIVVILLGFGLAGCGGSSNGSSNYVSTTGGDGNATISKIQVVKSHRLSDYYWLDDIAMPSGKILVCIEAYEYQDGGPAISCNWEAYNKP